jgi:hypothetical protein
MLDSFFEKLHNFNSKEATLEALKTTFSFRMPYKGIDEYQVIRKLLREAVEEPMWDEDTKAEINSIREVKKMAKKLMDKFPRKMSQYDPELTAYIAVVFGDIEKLGLCLDQHDNTLSKEEFELLWYLSAWNTRIDIMAMLFNRYSTLLTPENVNQALFFAAIGPMAIIKQEDLEKTRSTVTFLLDNCRGLLDAKIVEKVFIWQSNRWGASLVEKIFNEFSEFISNEAIAEALAQSSYHKGPGEEVSTREVLLNKFSDRMYNLTVSEHFATALESILKSALIQGRADIFHQTLRAMEGEIISMVNSQNDMAQVDLSVIKLQAERSSELLNEVLIAATECRAIIPIQQKLSRYKGLYDDIKNVSMLKELPNVLARFEINSSNKNTNSDLGAAAVTSVGSPSAFQVSIGSSSRSLIREPERRWDNLYQACSHGDIADVNIKIHLMGQRIEDVIKALKEVEGSSKYGDDTATLDRDVRIARRISYMLLRKFPNCIQPNDNSIYSYRPIDLEVAVEKFDRWIKLRGASNHNYDNKKLLKWLHRDGGAELIQSYDVFLKMAEKLTELGYSTTTPPSEEEFKAIIAEYEEEKRRRQVNPAFAIFVAAEFGDLELVNLFMARFADSITKEMLAKAWYLSASAGHSVLANALLSNRELNISRYALIVASEKGDLDQVSKLLPDDIDATAVSSALIKAACGGHKQVVESLLNNYRSKIGYSDINAAWYNSKRIMDRTNKAELRDMIDSQIIPMLLTAYREFIRDDITKNISTQLALISALEQEGFPTDLANLTCQFFAGAELLDSAKYFYRSSEYRFNYTADHYWDHIWFCADVIATCVTGGNIAAIGLNPPQDLAELNRVLNIAQEEIGHDPVNYGEDSLSYSSGKPTELGIWLSKNKVKAEEARANEKSAGAAVEGAATQRIGTITVTGIPETVAAVLKETSTNRTR